MACSIATSSTVSTQSTSARAMAIGVLPMSRTAMPSAMVSPPTVTGSPARSWCMAE